MAEPAVASVKPWRPWSRREGGWREMGGGSSTRGTRRNQEEKEIGSTGMKACRRSWGFKSIVTGGKNKTEKFEQANVAESGLYKEKGWIDDKRVASLRA
eukprot:758322-Hanusia_phi.AAC.6